MKSIKTLACAALLAAGMHAAQAAEPVQYNVVELQAGADREVANDLISAVLYTEHNDPNAQTVANAVNRALTEGLRVAKDYPAVKARSGNNQTTPVYGGSSASSTRATQLQGWRGRGEIRLESRDFAAAAALIGKLQAGGLQLGGISFGVAPETRKKAEDELIGEAIAAFKSRAELVKGAMGGKGYKIQRISLNTGYSGPPVPRMMAMAKSADFAPPPVEGGGSTVNVQVNGAVEVQ
ncbi:MAG: putative periplasmic/secreted protein [Betaproteobacteria bacterium]|nr:putative periplasmic/secreted protein [Betaproteobacteria bacterium]